MLISDQQAKESIIDLHQDRQNTFILDKIKSNLIISTRSDLLVIFISIATNGLATSSA